MQLEERMKFKQKVFIFIVILIVDMILAWGAVRMWKGRGEIFDTHEENRSIREESLCRAKG